MQGKNGPAAAFVAAAAACATTAAAVLLDGGLICSRNPPYFLLLRQTSCTRGNEGKIKQKQLVNFTTQNVTLTTKVIVRSLKSSILSSTSFQSDKTIWRVVSAVVDQSGLKANMVAQGAFNPKLSNIYRMLLFTLKKYYTLIYVVLFFSYCIARNYHLHE